MCYVERSAHEECRVPTEPIQHVQFHIHFYVGRNAFKSRGSSLCRLDNVVVGSSVLWTSYMESNTNHPLQFKLGKWQCEVDDVVIMYFHVSRVSRTSPTMGLEPMTTRLRALRSTIWARLAWQHALFVYFIYLESRKHCFHWTIIQA